MTQFPLEMHKASNNPNFAPRITSSEQAAEMGRKGGSVSSLAKRQAARLRVMKQQGMSDENVQWFYDALVDPESSLQNALFYIRTIMATSTNNKERAIATRLYLDWHKIKHGTAESHQKIDVTTRDYKFIIEMPAEPPVVTVDSEEVVVDGDGTQDTPLEANEETTLSLQVPSGQNNN